MGPIAVLDVLEKKNSLEAAGKDFRTIQPVARSLHLLRYSGFLLPAMACSEHLRKKKKGESIPAHHTYSLGYSDVYLLLIQTFSCRSIHIAYTESDVIFLGFNKYFYGEKKFQIKCVATYFTVQ